MSKFHQRALLSRSFHGRMKPGNMSYDKGVISILKMSLRARGLPLIVCFRSVTLIFKTDQK